MPEIVALIAALREELSPTVARLALRPRGDHFTGQAGTRTVLAATSGVGAARAVEAVDRMFTSHDVGHVIHLGFAGGLDPALAAGDVPAIRWVIDEGDGAVELTNDRPVPADSAARSSGRTLLTVGRLADTVEAKRRLLERHGASLVDMESYPVAKRCAALGVRLTILRAVSDAADAALPAAALDWIGPNGDTNIAAVARCVVARPWLVPTLLRLRRNTRLAADRLAQRAAQIIAAPCA